MKFRDSQSIYLQIAERICDEILGNKFPPGERIPSIREYAAMVEVNANTVVRSYEWLQQHEIIFNKKFSLLRDISYANDKIFFFVIKVFVYNKYKTFSL